MYFTLAKDVTTPTQAKRNCILVGHKMTVQPSDPSKIFLVFHHYLKTDFSIGACINIQVSEVIIFNYKYWYQ